VAENLFTIQTPSGPILIRFFLAALAGAIVEFSFNPEKWIWALFGLSGLIWLLSRAGRRSRFIVIAGFSVTFHGLHLTWMQVLGYDAWILLTLVSSIPWLIAAYVPIDKYRVKSIFTFAAVIVVVETLKSHYPLGGFPWGLIGYGQVDGPFANLAGVGGVALVTFVTVFVAGLLIQLFSRRFISATVILLLVSITVSSFSATQRSARSSQNDSFSIVAIQGNVPRIGLDLTSQRIAVLNNHLDLTTKYLSTKMGNKPQLIVWPESSTDLDPLSNTEVAQKIDQVVALAGAPILVGATSWNVEIVDKAGDLKIDQPTGPRNAGILWNPDGTKNFYVKNQLVPFGEYIPFRKVLTSFIDRLALVPNDYVAGDQLGLFTVDGVVFGDVICFEVAFGTYLRQLVNSGAQFITIQTNNATYGNTDQPEQQFQISRFRAIEHQRSILVASTSGISGAISPSGEVLEKTGQFESAVVQVELPVVTNKSISDRFPRWMAIISFITAGIAFTNTYRRNKSA
jgi:apolipoprotein N-acyltransferase